MKLIVLGSSSAGNCYILETETTALILECGVPLKEVKKTLKFDLSKIVGAFITHEHGDHAKYASQFADSCIPVYSSIGTIKAMGLDVYCNTMSLSNMSKLSFGEWSVYSFKVDHDAVEPFGFIIDHPESGPILFLTDTTCLRFKFPMKFSHMLIEANYSHDIMQERIMKGSFTVAQEERVKASHMSIDTTCEIIRNNASDALRNVILIHLSDGNSNAADFKERAQAIAPFSRVEVADKGMILELNKEPF